MAGPGSLRAVARNWRHWGGLIFSRAGGGGGESTHGGSTMRCARAVRLCEK